MTALKPDFRVYLGKSGSGKTHLALHQARRIRRLLIHDPNFEDCHAADAVVCTTPVDLVRVVSDKGPFRACWRGVVSMGPEAFEFANRVAWAAENMTVLWDEIDRFIDARRPPHFAYQIVNAGRHRRLRWLACSRRAARLSRDLTANATRIIAFRTTEPVDLKYLRDTMDREALRLPHLRRFEALDWTEHGAKVKKSPFS